jgi:hypothetical protein
MAAMQEMRSRSLANQVSSNINACKEHVKLLLKNNSLWSFFSSVKLTIMLLVLIVLVFIAAVDVQTVRRNLTRKT